MFHKMQVYNQFKRETLRLPKITYYNNLFEHDIDIHKFYTRMFITGRATDILPAWAFNEYEMMNIFTTDVLEHISGKECGCRYICSPLSDRIAYLLINFKIINLYTFKPFLQVHIKTLHNSKNAMIAVLNLWANSYVYEFNESYKIAGGGMSIIKVKPFPSDAIDYFKLNPHKILKHFAENPTGFTDLTIGW